MSVSAFEKHTGLNFTDKSLLQEALTHSSFAKRQEPSVRDNERLEFFGDAVLKLIISEYLYEKYPNQDEGELTKKRARMVADNLLATLSQSLNVGDYMRLSVGEIRGGGATRSSTIANAMEAILGAIYMDKGYAEAKTFFVNLLQNVGYNDDVALHDSKTTLQEWTQKQGCKLPAYILEKTEGPDHEKVFHITVSIELNGADLSATGYGNSKKEAEQHASKKLMSTIKQQ